MSGQSPFKPGDASSTSLASPDMMLGLWTSWVDAASKLASAGGAVPWQMSPDQITGDLLRGGIQQLSDLLAKDPILHAIETALNANPLRDVVPVVWAEIARALRTVWLHSLKQPDKAIASSVELNLRLWQSALDIWNEAGRRWMGLAPGNRRPQQATSALPRLSGSTIP